MTLNKRAHVSLSSELIFVNIFFRSLTHQMYNDRKLYFSFLFFWGHTENSEKEMNIYF